MTKQEEIRDGLIHWFAQYDRTLKDGNPPLVTDTLDSLLSHLQDNDVVIKVERELPEGVLDVLFYQRLHGKERTAKLQELLESIAGYVAVAPLIEDTVKLPQVVGRGGEANDGPLMEEEK